MAWYLKNSDCLTKYGFTYNSDIQMYEKNLKMHIFEVDEPYDEDDMEYDEPITGYVDLEVHPVTLELCIHCGINTRFRAYRSDSYSDFFDFSLDKIMDMMINGDIIRR